MLRAVFSDEQRDVSQWRSIGWMNSKSESLEEDKGLSPWHICGDGECCAGGSRMGGCTRRKVVTLLANAACKNSGITAVNCHIIPFFFSLLLERVESINKTDGSFAAALREGTRLVFAAVEGQAEEKLHNSRRRMMTANEPWQHVK